MILIAYDGSAEADRAIDLAAHLMPGAEATVVTVWEPCIGALMRSSSLSMGVEFAGGATDTVVLDQGYEASACATAADGASRAQQAGLLATSKAVRQSGSVAHTIERCSHSEAAEAIVLGRRGMSEIKSLLLGSVSRSVLAHASTTVIVVPAEVTAVVPLHSGTPPQRL